LLTLSQLEEVAVWQLHCEQVRQNYPKISGRRLIYETLRRIVHAFITDVINTTYRHLHSHRPLSPDAVRTAPALVAYGSSMQKQVVQLRQFLFKNLYRHDHVLHMAREAQHIIRTLFHTFSQNPDYLPAAYRHKAPATQARLIAHYIAGMTDRYAFKTYHRFGKKSP